MVAATTSWLNGLGQKLAIAGVLKTPTSAIWNFVSGVSAVWNEAEGRWDLTVSGGGGGSGDVVGPASAVDSRLVLFNGTTGKLIKAATMLVGDLILRTGAVPFQADQSMGGHKLTTLQDGVTGTQDAASVAQVEALIAASTSNVADWKQSVRLATTAALAANTRVSNVLTANANGAMATIDGVAPAVGNRILVKDEVTGANRGIYTVTSLGSAGTPWVLTRATDADSSAEVTCGLTCLVEEGTANAGKPYILTTANPITLNTTALTFSALSSATGDEVNIHSSAGVLSLIAGSITNAQLAGSISWAKLLTAIGNLSFTGLKTLSYTGEVDNGNSSTADTIDWSAGSLQKSTLTGNCTFTFTNLAAGTDYRLKLIQDGTGSRTVTWPAITWLNGSAPTLATAAGAVDFVGLYYDGTTLWGSVSGIADGAFPWAKMVAAAKGQSPVYNGSTWVFFGVATKAANLTDASVTVTVTDGNRMVLAAATLTTTRNLTLGITGSPTDKEIITVERYDTTANTYVVKNNAGTTLYTFPASTKRMASFQYQAASADWILVSHVAITS